MFLGAHIRPLESGLRIRLPTSFLEEIGQDSIYLTAWPTRCVCLLQDFEWKRLIQRLQSIPFPKDKRAAERFFVAYAFITKLDKRGRISIPGQLQSFAHLTSDVLLLGLVNRVELWNPKDFNSVGAGEIKETFPFLLPKELIEAYGYKASQLVSQVRQSYKRVIGHYKSHTEKGAKHLFLCYSSRDKKFVRRLARDLTREGITVWFDEWEMLPGDSLYEKIQSGIQRSSWFGVILSPDSVKSKWCKRELHNALEEEFKRSNVFVIPVLYRTCEVPGFLKEKVYVDLRKGKYTEEFPYLLQRFDI